MKFYKNKNFWFSFFSIFLFVLYLFADNYLYNHFLDTRLKEASEVRVSIHESYNDVTGEILEEESFIKVSSENKILPWYIKLDSYQKYDKNGIFQLLKKDNFEEKDLYKNKIFKKLVGHSDIHIVYHAKYFLVSKGKIYRKTVEMRTLVDEVKKEYNFNNKKETQ